MSSFSPWIFTVGAAAHDRVYHNSIGLGNNQTISRVGIALATGKDTMYRLISTTDALNNSTSTATDIYSIRYVLGLFTIKKAVETVSNLSSAGIVFFMDPCVIGFPLNPVPMKNPNVIIPTADDSKILLQYFNSSVERDGQTRKVISFIATTLISGGPKANYSFSAPKVMYYSARGPDLQNTYLDNADVLKPNFVAPGHVIWAAWSSCGADSVEFQGENFAMLSGTSTAAPHIAGLAALIKPKFPSSIPRLSYPHFLLQRLSATSQEDRL